MSFKQNTAISNFPIGRLVDKITGDEITLGTVTGTYILDGVSDALSGTISYDSTACVWVIDNITADEINGIVGSYQFSHAYAVGGGISIPIKTLTKLVSDLHDYPLSGTVTVVSPVGPTGADIALRRGDDYLAVDGRALDFSSDAWPDLTGATLVLRIGLYAEFDGTVLDASSARVELTAEQTTTLAAGRRRHILTATLANSDVITLVTGWTVVS